MKPQATLIDINKILHGKIYGDGDVSFCGISTDSRSIKSGMLFVALNGKKFKGSDFIEMALRNGAVAVIAQDVDYLCNGIKVKDTLLAYQALALWYRQQLDAQIVAVTGSCGKTSVKEILATIMLNNGVSFKNQANFNNQIGVAKTLLEAPLNSVFGVVEAGTNHIGEIKPLADIIKPNISIITNVGISHTEHFAKIEDLITEKMSLCTAMADRGVSLLPGDIEYSDIFLSYPNNKIFTYGLDNTCDYYPDNLSFDNLSRPSFDFKGIHFKLNLYGTHSVRNAIAALSAADILGINLSNASKTLIKYFGYDKRFLMCNTSGYTLIDDTYNANLISTIASIKTLGLMQQSGKKIVVLGSMLELGENSDMAHQKVIDYASKLVDIIYTIGYEYANVAKGIDKVNHFTNQTDLLNTLISNADIEDIILFKGSRGAKMENILEAFKIAVSKDD